MFIPSRARSRSLLLIVKRAGEELNDYSYWPGSWPSKDTNKLAHISAQAIDTVPFASGRFKLLAPGCPLRYGKQLSGEHNDCGIWVTQHTLNVQPDDNCPPRTPYVR